MSKTDASPGSLENSAAIREQLTLLMTARLQQKSTRCEIIPAELLQGAALSLIEARPIPAADRIHFLAESAPILRQVLSSLPAHPSVFLNTGLALPGGIEAARLDEALTRLEAADPMLAGMAEARCYGGLLPEEQPALSDLTPAELERRWRIARAWLQDAISSEQA
ncbi:MAG: ECF-type sigma factor [Hyphomonas sp.]